MRTYKAYCFDLDGTVYRGKEGIATAVAFIHRLQAAHIEPFYVTNNASKTREQLQQALKDIGIDAPLEHIYSSALATAKYVAQHHQGAKVQMIGTEGLHKALQDEGIEIVEVDADIFVMGIDRELTYNKLMAASIAVQQGAKLIGTNGDVKFPNEDGFAPANGSFVNLVANVAGVEPLYVGKPSPLMLQVIAQEHHVEKEDMVMVGDNYDTDILCGIHFGCDTIHVNTGVTPTEIVIKKPWQPTYLVDNLSKL